ncbi:MAG: portal protein [Pseudomonadota bacterium]
MPQLSLPDLLARFRSAAERRAAWDGLWRDCYAYTVPQRDGGAGAPGRQSIETMYDGTAADAVEQLAASLLAELMPPGADWLSLEPAVGTRSDEIATLAPALEDATRRALLHFHRSNFAVELHQCFLDLACVGTATLAFEEAPTGEASAFRFTAVPSSEIFVDAGPGGQIRGHFRVNRLRAHDLVVRYPEERLPEAMRRAVEEQPQAPVRVIEAVLADQGGFAYTAFVQEGPGGGTAVLDEGTFQTSPFLTFRWNKGAGEAYGRSPVMTALPDIKTANKVVELVLKNASMAVTGMWQADDDGVLNPHNIRLVPGAIIPKAPGSSGLTPLATPGRFEVSELVLNDLRARIRHALLVDRMGPLDGPKMTATEVLERASEAARLLGAIYGRLQGELIEPLLRRALAILVRRGELPPFVMDRRVVEARHQGPLARAQARGDVQHVLMWLEQARGLGEAGAAVVDEPAVARWLARRLGVPAELVRDPEPEVEAAGALLGEVAAALTGS